MPDDLFEVIYPVRSLRPFRGIRQLLSCKSIAICFIFKNPFLLFVIFNLVLFSNLRGYGYRVPPPPLKACYVHDMDTNIKLTLNILSNAIMHT